MTVVVDAVTEINHASLVKLSHRKHLAGPVEVGFYRRVLAGWLATNRANPVKPGVYAQHPSALSAKLESRNTTDTASRDRGEGREAAGHESLQVSTCYLYSDRLPRGWERYFICCQIQPIGLPSHHDPC